MNNTFSLHRVALYARKHYVENGRSYLFGLIGLVALASLILYYTGSIEFLSLLLLLCWIYFTQISCQSHYARRSMEQSYTLPATSTEKFLFIWSNSAIIVPLLSSAIVMILSVIFSFAKQDSLGLIPSNIDNIVVVMLLLYQAGALFSCCWIKSSPLKGYLILVSILMGIGILYGTFNYYLIRNSDYSIDILNATCYTYMDAARIYYPLLKGFNELVITLGMGFWAVGFWVIAYFKFKERTLK